MSEADNEAVEPESREKTDLSLQIEREKVNNEIGAKRDIDDGIDEALRSERQRNDDVVEAARAESARDITSSVDNAKFERDRVLADAILEQERAKADAMLERERSQREHFLVDFLASEREATDEALDAEREQADAAMGIRDEFLAMVSHDLRSLLGGLRLNTEMTIRHADNGPDGEKVRRYATRSLRLVARISRLANDLYDVASIDAGKLAVVRSTSNVSHILRDTLDAFGPVALAKRVRMKAHNEDANLYADVDAGRVLQVLANLVSNAIRFTPEGGLIRIDAWSENNQVHFTVADSGVGIEDDALIKVFERFSQLNAGRRGLGLGLYISKCIVEAHDGKIWVESTLGKGSIFHFLLPIQSLATH